MNVFDAAHSIMEMLNRVDPAYNNGFLISAKPVKDWSQGIPGKEILVTFDPVGDGNEDSFVTFTLTVD